MLLAISRSATWQKLNVMRNTFLLFAFIASMIIAKSAHAEYAAVIGSFADRIHAESMVFKHTGFNNKAVIVRTKATGYSFRVLVGCYRDESDAFLFMGRLEKSDRRGVWILKTRLGCGKTPQSASSGSLKHKLTLNSSGQDARLDGVVIRRPDAAPPRPVSEETRGGDVDRFYQTKEPPHIKPIELSDRDSLFKPKKWIIKTNYKVVYTGGENPAMYFNQSQSASDGVCRVVIGHYVDSLSNIKPEVGRENYEFKVNSKIFPDNVCHVAHVYEVRKYE